MSGQFGKHRNIIPLSGSQPHFLYPTAPRLVAITPEKGLTRLQEQAFCCIPKKAVRNQTEGDTKTDVHPVV
jgi:hypothetical protein